MSVPIPVSWGELIDKVTILEIKMDHIPDPGKLAHVQRELEALRPLGAQALMKQPSLEALVAALKSVNSILWEVEDQIRECEREKEFGSRFIELARAVYHQNDRRAFIKRQINVLLDSDLIEEKSYSKY